MIKGKGRKGWTPRAKAGITAVIVVLIIFLIPLISPVQHNDSRDYRIVRDNDSGWRQDRHLDENNPQSGVDISRNSVLLRDQRQVLEEEDHDGYRIGGNKGTVIMGNMSLQEVSDNTGVPVNHLIKKLNLPVNVPVRETLGRLRRSYGFQIQDVRDVVAKYN